MGMHERIRAMTIRQLGVGKGGKGASATLYKTIDGEFNPSTGAFEESTQAEYLGSGVRVNYTNFSYRNEAIEHGDFQLYLSPVLQSGEDCPEPKIDDTLLFLSDVYKVINLEPWNAAGIECGWKLQMRKG